VYTILRSGDDEVRVRRRNAQVDPLWGSPISLARTGVCVI
jgi:hypothetical protein